MNKDKLIADIVHFILALLLGLGFICCTWFDAVEPSWIDLLLRLTGSLMLFILGMLYRDWQQKRKRK